MLQQNDRNEEAELAHKKFHQMYDVDYENDKLFKIISGISGANLFTSEAIFLLSYRNYEPIKLQSKQKSFVSKSAIVS